MTVTLAALRRSPGDGSTAFAPYASEVPPLDDNGYVQEEWIATGDEDGLAYATALCVRRPRDPRHFSGRVIVEPLHVHGIAPIWLYCGPYVVRSGHAWVEIAAQKTTLDMHVKPSNPQRYQSLHIEGPDTSDFDANPQLGDPEKSELFWSELERRNRATSTILAQVGAALRASPGPFDGQNVANVVLAGHSQTGSVITYYIRDAHGVERLPDGSPVYDGYFPSGFPFDPFHDVDVPIVQVMSEGDIALPAFSFRPGYGGRKYRRNDSDDPGDRYRLYELAGVPHMGTRYPPYNDVTLWIATFPGEIGVTFGPRMNSLPHFELYRAALHHLLEWLDDGVAPPRSERIEVAEDGYFANDEHGNSRGGVRCVQMDVPHSTYRSNPLHADGTPSYLTVGVDEPFAKEKLRSLYLDPADYVGRFDRRLKELVDEGWLLTADAEEMRREARRVEF
jgi:hypothetical protein